MMPNVIKEISGGKVSPVYLFYGTEKFLLREAVNRLEEAVVPQEARDFNLSVLDLRETPLEQVLMDAETFPVLADRRLVIGKNALFLTASRQTGGPEHNVDALVAYLEQPPDYTVLVLVVPEGKLDERKNIVKKLKKQAVMIPCEPLQGMDLVKWLQARAKEFGVSLPPKSAEKMVEYIGNDLQTLHQELEKMSTYTGQGGTIVEQTVELLGSRSLEQDIFTLVNRVVEVKLEEAYRVLHDLLRGGEEPIKILSLLARQFRLMLLAKTLKARGYGQQQIASALKVHPYAAKLAEQQGSRFSEKQLRGILSLLAEEDYRMKSGQVDKVLSLELFLSRLGKVEG